MTARCCTPSPSGAPAHTTGNNSGAFRHRTGRSAHMPLGSRPRAGWSTASSSRPGRLEKGSQPLDEARGPAPLLRRHRRLLGESRSAPHVASSSCPRALRRGSEAGNQGTPHPTAPAALARNRRASIHADTTAAPARCPAYSSAGTTAAGDCCETPLGPPRRLAAPTPPSPAEPEPFPLTAAAQPAGCGRVQTLPDGSTDALTQLRSLSSARSRWGLLILARPRPGGSGWSPER